MKAKLLEPTGSLEAPHLGPAPNGWPLLRSCVVLLLECLELFARTLQRLLLLGILLPQLVNVQQRFELWVVGNGGLE